MWPAEKRNRVHMENPISKHLTKSNQWFVRIPHCGTLMFSSQSLSKLMHPKKGPGAALLQDGCPVAFATKSLTPVDQCYANIEGEMLTCVFRAE